MRYIEAQHGLARDGGQAAVVAAGVLDQLLAHARIPEGLQVLRSRMNGRFVVGIGAEEPADVVGHLDQVMNIHGVKIEIRRPQLLLRLRIEGKAPACMPFFAMQ